MSGRITAGARRRAAREARPCRADPRRRHRRALQRSAPLRHCSITSCAGRRRAHPLLAALGPEPLEPGFDGALSEPRARRQDDADQIGAARPAHRRRARQHLCLRGAVPGRHIAAPAGRHGRRRAGRHGSRRRCARCSTEAIAAGGSSLRDYVQANGELGYFQHRWAVYGKEGEPCPGCTCAEGVRRITQAGRSTFFCGKRQR